MAKRYGFDDAIYSFKRRKKLEMVMTTALLGVFLGLWMMLIIETVYGVEELAKRMLYITFFSILAIILVGVAAKSSRGKWELMIQGIFVSHILIMAAIYIFIIFLSVMLTEEFKDGFEVIISVIALAEIVIIGSLIISLKY